MNDTVAYQIGTRNATTLLRLKDGETQILAGLISDQDRRTSTHIPGLGDMPILGRLFGSRKDDVEKTEIVLSITPRIIRSQPRPGNEDSEFLFGTQSNLRSASLAAGEAAGGCGEWRWRQGSPPWRCRLHACRRSAAPEAADGGTQAGPKPRPVLTWDGPGQVVVGQDFDVNLMIASEAELSNIRSSVRFDAAVFEITGADAGEIIPAEARATTAPNVDQRNGRAQMEVKGGAVSGEGTFLVLHVRALSPRPTSMFSVQQFAAVYADGNAVPAMAPRPLVVVVTP